MNSLFRYFKRDDKFFTLLEASAVEAQGSVTLLSNMLRNPDGVPTLDEFVQTRRKDKQITEEISEQLCRTFVTPLEREDIEALSTALYKIPKSVEKFGEKFLLCHERTRSVDFLRQVAVLEQATAVVTEMVRKLRQKAHLEEAKEQNDRLHYLEGQADKIMLELIKGLYSGEHDPLQVVILMDLHEMLEKTIDRCRDAGNIMFQIVLKYS